MASSKEELASFYTQCAFCECDMITEAPLSQQWDGHNFCSIGCMNDYMDEQKDQEDTERELSRSYHFI